MENKDIISLKFVKRFKEYHLEIEINEINIIFSLKSLSSYNKYIKEIKYDQIRNC